MTEAQSSSANVIQCNGIANSNVGCPVGPNMGSMWFSSPGVKDSSPREIFQNGLHSPKVSDFPQLKEQWIRSPQVQIPGSPLVSLGNFVAQTIMGQVSSPAIKTLSPCSIGGVPRMSPGSLLIPSAPEGTASLTKHQYAPDKEFPDVRVKRLRTNSDDYTFQKMKIPRYRFTTEDDAYYDEETDTVTTTRPTSRRKKRGKNNSEKSTRSAGKASMGKRKKRAGKRNSVTSTEGVVPEENALDQTAGSSIKSKKYSIVPPMPASMNGTPQDIGHPTFVPPVQRFFPFNFWQPQYVNVNGSLLKTNPSASYGGVPQNVGEGGVVPCAVSVANGSDMNERLGVDKIPMHYGEVALEGTSTETYVIERPGCNTTTTPSQLKNSAKANPNSVLESQIPGKSYNFAPLQYPVYNGAHNTAYNVYANALPAYPPIAPDPYYWLRENNVVNASLHPTFIKPKPMVVAPPFGYPYNGQDCGYYWAYPSVANVFQNAGLSVVNEVSQKGLQKYIETAGNQNEPLVNVGTSWNVVPTSSSTRRYENGQGPLLPGNPPVQPNPDDQAPLASEKFSYNLTIVPPTPPIHSTENIATQLTEKVNAVPGEPIPENPLFGENNRHVAQELPEVDSHQSRAKEKKRFTGEHICSVCGKKYARAFTLKTHMRVHTGEKPFKCKVCERPFAQGSGLESHMRVHTGLKPYKCVICERGFSHSSAVKSHMRTHTGEKPFSCGTCGKNFADQSTVKKHERTHTGLKPFSCTECSLCFTQIGNMNKHLKNIHGREKQIVKAKDVGCVKEVLTALSC